MFISDSLNFPMKLKANADTVSGIMTGFRKRHKYIDGKPTDSIEAITYNVILPQSRYQMVSIKIDQQQPIIAAEELEAKSGTVKVKIFNLSASMYQNKNKDVVIFCKADNIEVI